MIDWSTGFRMRQRSRQLMAIARTQTDDYVHPAAIGIALGGFGLFPASWFGWTFGYTALAIAIIGVLTIMYFGPMVGAARISAEFRGEVTHRSFRQFLVAQVGIFTGRISGSAALVQIALMPVLLGGLMCFFAAVWLGVRG